MIHIDISNRPHEKLAAAVFTGNDWRSAMFAPFAELRGPASWAGWSGHTLKMLVWNGTCVAHDELTPLVGLKRDLRMEATSLSTLRASFHPINRRSFWNPGGPLGSSVDPPSAKICRRARARKSGCSG
jgi:hypothetical protein